MTLDAVTVRPAALADAPAVTALMAMLGYTIEAPAAATRIARLLERPDDLLLLAIADGQPIGFLHAIIWEFIESDPTAVVAALVVDRRARQHGTGRLLMGRAEDWARERACPVVRLWSSAARTEAHKFYERLGYTKIKTQFAFAKSLSPDGDLSPLVPKIED